MKLQKIPSIDLRNTKNKCINEVYSKIKKINDSMIFKNRCISVKTNL